MAAPKEKATESTAVADYTGLRTMIETLRKIAVTPETQTFDVDKFMEGILQGQTPDEVFEAQQLTALSSQDYLEEPFYLKADGISWRYSALADGFPFYAMITATERESGEEITVNGGGFSFVTTLFRLQTLNWFDPAKHPHDAEKGQLMKFQGKRTLSGNTVVLLMPVRSPAQKRASARAES
jgi:hypothetical protein